MSRIVVFLYHTKCIKMCLAHQRNDWTEKTMLFVKKMKILIPVFQNHKSVHIMETLKTLEQRVKEPFHCCQ